MGSGIAQVVAASGLGVTVVDVDDAAIERGLARIARGLEKAGADVAGGALADHRLDEPRGGRGGRPTT